MEFRNLRGTELKVSAVALGGNTFGPPRLDEAQSIRAIHAADDFGVNFVDTANIYGSGQSEAFVGKALADRRNRWLIATKFNFRNRGETNVGEHIAKACEESLRQLNTDRIDLYQVHLPDLTVAEDEILRALDKLLKAGKVREIGVSNYQSWHLAKSHYVARAMGVRPYATTQDHYNLQRRNIEAELIPFADHYGMSIITYFPLAGGFLSGKYKQGTPPPPGTRGAEGSGIVARNLNDRSFAIVQKLETFAAARGRSMVELALAWLLANPAVGCVITGVSNPEQVAMNVKAAGWTLTPEEKGELDQISPREGDDTAQPVGARAATKAG